MVWNVNSTAQGGGVAEMLHSLLAYARGAGVDARWIVIAGDPEFFRVTKRLHNRLHGAAGRRRAARRRRARRLRGHYCAERARSWPTLVRPGDIVFLHDPQTAGLVAARWETGASAWSGAATSASTCPNERTREAWDFLRPYVAPARRVRVLARRVRLGGPRPRP